MASDAVYSSDMYSNALTFYDFCSEKNFLILTVDHFNPQTPCRVFFKEFSVGNINHRNV